MNNGSDGMYMKWTIEWWMLNWFDKLDWHFIWNSVALIIIWAVLLSTVCYSSFTTASWHLPFTASDCYFRPKCQLVSTCRLALLLSLDKETGWFSVFCNSCIFFRLFCVFGKAENAHLHLMTLMMVDPIYISQMYSFTHIEN